MATRIYGLSRGDTDFKVTEGVGSATASKNMEFTFDLAVSLKKEEVLRGLDSIKDYILAHKFPPA